MHRLIHSLLIELQPPPGVHYQAIIARLDRQGCNLLKSGVQPRAPKTRIVDVRVGDDVLLQGQWRRVVGISMHQEWMLTDEEAAKHEGDGWLVKARPGYVSPIGPGSVRRG